MQQSENRSDEVKSQFRAREGHYRLMNSPDFSQRSQRALNVGATGHATSATTSNLESEKYDKTSIKISLVTINDSNDPISGVRQRTPEDQTYLPNNPVPDRGQRRTRDRKICFNVGTELYVYNYDGIKNGPSASGSIFRKSFKNYVPTCHDFNQATATSSSICLLVGFSQGQVQLIDLTGDGCEKQENFKEFNVDRLIDRTRVTCIRWLPNSPSLFLVAHASGQLYLYKNDLLSGPGAPVYQIYKQLEGVVIYTCKTKATRNPIYKWAIGGQPPEQGSTSNLLGSSTSLHNMENECYSLNEFAFSPCAKYLACASQDGFLRVFCYDTMELVGRARSYYGGLTCVCWSPDGKYVVTGGEDDLVTIWSFVERRVVARGMGHRSWVSVVSFDRYYGGHDTRNTDVDNDDDDDDDVDADADLVEEDEEGNVCYGNIDDDIDDDDIIPYKTVISRSNRNSKSPSDQNLLSKKNISGQKSFQTSPILHRRSSTDVANVSSPYSTTYRFGSVGHDTQLCLWDLSDDILKQPVTTKTSQTDSSDANKSSQLNDQSSTSSNQIEELETQVSSLQIFDQSTNDLDISKGSESIQSTLTKDLSEVPSTSGGFLTLRSSGFSKTFSLIGRKDKRNLSLRNLRGSIPKSDQTPHYQRRSTDDPIKLLGSSVCPRMNQVPVIQPSVCKKISYERLTSLLFLRGGFITSCQEGSVYSWARINVECFEREREIDTQINLA